MIRAMSKSENDYIYIYSIYKNDGEFYYLASSATHQGLIVYSDKEIYNIEILSDNYIKLNTFDISATSDDQMHPILFDFLKNDWETYEGIIEGQNDSWLKFQRKLRHRP